MSDPPLQLIRSILWELYELNFHYELSALDQVLATHLWATSDGAPSTRQALLYDIFSSDSGLRMTSGPLPQQPHELGICAVAAEIALPYLNNFCKLLSAWPGAPTRLGSPVELDGVHNTMAYDTYILACQFYLQTAFEFFGRQPSIPRVFSFI